MLEAINTLPGLPDSVVKFNEYKRLNGVYMPNDEMIKLLEANEPDRKIIFEVARGGLYNFNADADLKRIVTLLGSISVKNILMAEIISNNFKFNILPRNLKGDKQSTKFKCVCDLSPYGLDGESFFDDCERELEVISAWVLAEDKQNHTLIPSLMLLRLGLVLFSQILILNNLHEAFFNELSQGGFNNLLEVETKFLGADHIELLHFLLEKYEADPILISSVAHLKDPDKAEGKIIKNAWIFNISNFLFDPYQKITKARLDKALSLMNELGQKGINFKSDLLEAEISKKYFL